MERVIRVTGVGIVNAKPDKIEIIITNKSVASTHEDCARLVADTIDNVISRLETDCKIDKGDIYSSRFSVRKAEYRDKTNQFLYRYEGTQSLTITFDKNMELLNTIIHNISNYDVSVNINFVVSDITLYKEKAIKEAVADATRKAEILADSAHVGLGKLVDINYAWSTVNVTTVRKSAAMEFGGVTFGDTTNVQLNPENQKVQETVTMTWMIQ